MTIFTTYDQVWHSFVNKTKTSDLVLPTSDSAIHETIQNAIRYYNNRLSEELEGDNKAEVLNQELDSDHMLILVHYIRLIILENELVYQTTTLAPFTKELGIRNVGNQRLRLEELVNSEKKRIEGFIMNMSEDFL